MSATVCPVTPMSASSRLTYCVAWLSDMRKRLDDAPVRCQNRISIRSKA
jgi:hypothetical protein